MAYGNPYANYQPLQRYEIIKAKGKSGAEAKMLTMAPNSQAIFLDESAPVVWLAIVDEAGNKTLSPYDITPAKTQEEKDAARYAELEQRIIALEGMIRESNSVGNQQQ